MQALINRITHYGSRRLEDFNKYEAVRLAEELVSVAKTTGHAEAASYHIIATTLREKIHVSKEQFKAYFLALLADKEFTRIFDAISKVDKSFKRPPPYFRTQPRGNKRFSSPNPRVTCYRCGTPATSLHNVGSDLRRLAIFLQAVRATTNPGRQLSRKINPTPYLYKFGLY